MSELLVVAVLVLLLFGPRRLPEIGRTVGQALREFKRGMNEVKRELDEMDRSTGSREEGRREAPRGRLTPPGRAGENGEGPETAPEDREDPSPGPADPDPGGDGDADGEES